MRKINYKSDFTTVVHLKNQHGEKVPWPQCDWSATFWKNDKARTLKASCINGQYTNCNKESDGGILFIFNSHHLGLGRLLMEPHFMLPNGAFSDGTQDIYGLQSLDIELVAGAGDCETEAEVEAILPFIKGEPFTYEDFTPEQIEDLQRPATDAAEKLDGFVQTASKAETIREANEKQRVSAEQTRVAKETKRESAEATRQSQETQRIEAEADREEAETERKSAEETRAEEFATWQTEIDSKADRSELSNVIAEEPLTPDNFPDIDMYTREELKKDLFIDTWNSAWGIYGKYDPDNAPDAEHPFMGNDIWMTYEEAIRVMHNSVIYSTANAELYAHKNPNCRTLIPIVMNGLKSCQDMYNRCATIEALRIKSQYGDRIIPPNVSNFFYGCKNLKEVYGVLDFNGISTTASPTLLCAALEGLYIIRLRADLVMSHSPKWRLDCIEYLIQNATNTTPVTITVHPGVYAKLTDETNTEWHQVLIDAAAKNITFATT